MDRVFSSKFTNELLKIVVQVFFSWKGIFVENLEIVISFDFRGIHTRAQSGVESYDPERHLGAEGRGGGKKYKRDELQNELPSNDGNRGRGCISPTPAIVCMHDRVASTKFPFNLVKSVPR